jgi:hypothetical protein
VTLQLSHGSSCISEVVPVVTILLNALDRGENDAGIIGYKVFLWVVYNALTFSLAVQPTEQAEGEDGRLRDGDYLWRGHHSGPKVSFTASLV